MRVLMLGWEYPPHISGGLGTACEGLSKALARTGVEITFVVPHLIGGEQAPHMRLVDPSALESAGSEKSVSPSFSRPKIKQISLPAFLKPYWNPFQYRESLPPDAVKEHLKKFGAAHRYGLDLFSEVARYTERVISLGFQEEFDLIHAHDWMTYPAGVALSQATGKPLVVHVHSLEFDRSGPHGNERIIETERMGVRAANAVIAVSYYTKSLIGRDHGVPKDKVFVVHNGVYPKRVVQSYREEERVSSKVVLFLGRVTFQKGPDYFVEAAAKVVPHLPEVLFVMAGDGDMLPRCKKRVEELGIANNFLFPGFLRGQSVERMFSIADLYVMPSVSEPFGISALEAISFDTPVIISKQSGVSEVLGHALKADFWDVDRLADLIINGLLHEELRNDMISMAREEVRRVHWDAAAIKTAEVYQRLLPSNN